MTIVFFGESVAIRFANDGVIDGGDTLLSIGAYATDDGALTFNTSALPSLQQLQVLRLIVACDFAAATSYSGSFRFTVAATDVAIQEAEGVNAVTLANPATLQVTNRTLSVAP